ncbi:MAG: dockerin type I repeat-containing protein [Clostridia bacterium]|nr:dockerin type I repeat-containing protein [Clostridia bacterium]
MRKQIFNVIKFVLFTVALSAMLLFAVSAADNVVYLKDGGTGDGSSPDNAVNTLTKAHNALDLTKDDATIVVCGTFTQEEDFDYGTNYDGKVTFTSVFDGTDYRETVDAAWQFKASRLACYGDTAFENISFVSLVTEDDEATGDYYRIVGQHHAVTLGEGVTVTGDKLYGTLMANSFVILGGFDKGFGYSNAATAADVNVTVLSGSKLYIIPYSHNILGTYTGTSNITIGGTADVSVLLGSCAYPNGVTVGDVRVKLTDSCTLRKFYGCVQDTTMNSLEFEWESGTVHTSFYLSNSDNNTLTVSTPTILRVSDKAAASMYYAGVAGKFDTVISSAKTPTDITPASPSDSVSLALAARGKAYSAFTFDTIGENVAQVSIKLPADAANGIVYRVNGEFITPIDADPVGNGHMAFDLTDSGTYVCADTDFVTYGDINSDGIVNIADALCIIKIALGYRGTGLDVATADMDHNEKISIIDALRLFKTVVASDTEEEFTFDPNDYNVISVNKYLDKTKLGFLSQMVGFLSGYEFAKDSSGKPLIAMEDSWFEMCNGPYAEYNANNPHTDKLLCNEETGIWEVWTDDDFSIDILNQYILRDMYSRYGTVNTKVITDDWVKYDVYDMGGGNRDIGAYGLMSRYQYLSVFAGSTEVGNNFNVNGEPYIGNETLGMDAAGMPDLAIDLASKFGSTTSDRDPLEWLKMFAAMYSAAYFEDDIPTLIRDAQAAALPKGSWPYEVVDTCFELYEKYPDNWRAAIIEADTVFRSLNYDNSGYMGCSSINCSFIILGLLYGDGNYYETCKIISLAGHGGDSTTPTALGVVGVVCGWSNLDSTSKSIINEKVWQGGEGIIVNLPIDETSSYGTWMHSAGLDERFSIKALIYMYQDNFENLLYENGGFKKDGYYYIPKTTAPKIDTVYADSFETTGVSEYKAKGGTVTLADVPFMGSNAVQVNAASSGDSVGYTTVSGLTVGETYKLSAFIRTTEGVTAHMFVRESGAEIKTFVTAHDPGSYITRYTVGVGANDVRSYIKRELVFTATATSMEIGLMVEDGAPDGGNASFDAVSLVRFDETSVSDVTVSGAKNADGSYNGQIRFDIAGGADEEVWLKLTYSSNATALQKAVTLVNRAWQSRTPIAPTGSGKVTVYIPVLVDKEENNLVTMYVGDTNVTVHEAALVTTRERF